jgi:hypothetical protein
MLREHTKQSQLLRVALVVSLIGLVVTSTLITAAAQTTYDGRHSPGEPPEPHNNYEFLLSHSENIGSIPTTQQLLNSSVDRYYGMWSAIPSSTLTHYRSHLENETAEDVSELSVISAIKYVMVVTGDYITTYDEYPSIVRDWNARTMQSFSAGGKDTSRHPTSVNPTDSRYVKTAYVDIVSINPTVKLHETDTTPVRLSRANGDVHYATDYRVAVPEDSSTGNGVGDTRREYELRGHDIVQTELRSETGAGSIDISGSHTGTLRFNNLAEGNNELTVRTTIEARTNVHVEVKRRECTSRNETTGVCEASYTFWDTTRDEVVTDRVRVEDTTTVTHDPISKDEYAVKFRNHPDGKTIMRVETGTRWVTAEFPNGEILTSPYRMYSHRDQQWDRVELDTATESATSTAAVHPAELHAAPWEDGVKRRLGTGTTGIEFTVTNAARDVITAPPKSQFPTALQERYGFNVPSDTYQQPTGLNITSAYGKALEPGDVVAFHSFVGESIIVAAQKDGEIKRSSLNVTVVNDSRDSTGEITAHVELTEKKTGNAISTTGRNGHVTIVGREVNTGSDGTATITFTPDGRIIGSTYRPSTSWGHDTVYLKDAESTVLPTKNFTVLELIETWFPILIVFGVLYLLIKLIWNAIRPNLNA